MFAQAADRNGPDLDLGPKSTKSATERMCALTRQVKPIDELIRFVLSPDGTAVPDLKRKLPGRGLWLTADCHTVAEATRKNLFARGFKAGVKPQPDLAARTESLLTQSALDALAMAAKAGQAVSGFTRVEESLRAQQAVAVLHASDGAVDGVRKLDAVVRRGAALPIVAALTSAQLDLALGRSNVIHAALLAGPASKTFLSRCHILVRYRMAESDKTSGLLKQGETDRAGDAHAATGLGLLNG